MFAYPRNLRSTGLAHDRVYLGDTEGSDIILEMSLRGDTITTLPVRLR